MRLVPFLIFLTLFSVSIKSLATCKKVANETFSAVFKLVEISDGVTTECLFDELGKPHTNLPIQFDQKGCILHLEIIKLKKGNLPILNKTSDGKYLVYSDGPFCRTKIGIHLTKKLLSTTEECCKKVEDDRHTTKYQYCTREPTPRLIEQPSADNIRCTSEGRNWKFIDDK